MNNSETRKPTDSYGLSQLKTYVNIPIKNISKHDEDKCQAKVSKITIRNVPLVSLLEHGQELICLAQLSNTLLNNYNYNEIHNRRVALGINCVQCTPVQLDTLRRSGAIVVSSRRCGLIRRRDAERLVKSFLDEIRPPKFPDSFVFDVEHICGWGCRGQFHPMRYSSSRAKCIRCHTCEVFYSPNKFVFHSHVQTGETYVEPDTANFNSWRRHLNIINPDSDEHLNTAWEDIKAIFNGGTRKRINKGRALPDAESNTSSSSIKLTRRLESHGGQTQVRKQIQLKNGSNQLADLSASGVAHSREPRVQYDGTQVSLDLYTQALISYHIMANRFQAIEQQPFVNAYKYQDPNKLQFFFPNFNFGQN
jgi:hypothetical protein